MTSLSVWLLHDYFVCELSLMCQITYLLLNCQQPVLSSPVKSRSPVACQLSVLSHHYARLHYWRVFRWLIVFTWPEYPGEEYMSISCKQPLLWMLPNLVYSYLQQPLPILFKWGSLGSKPGMLPNEVSNIVAMTSNLLKLGWRIRSLGQHRKTSFKATSFHEPMNRNYARVWSVVSMLQHLLICLNWMTGIHQAKSTGAPPT